MKQVIQGIVVEDGHVLLVRKNDAWIFPGGKLEEGESHLACLAREFREELSGTKINPKSAEYFGRFEGISPNRKMPIEIISYMVELDSDIGEASAEIREQRMMGYSDMERYNLTDGTRYFVGLLKCRNEI